MQPVAKIEKVASPPSSCGRLTIKITSLDGSDGLQHIADAWRDLEGRTNSPSLFASVDWASHVLEHFAGTKEREFVIATAYADETLIALWPLAIRKQGVLRVLTSIGAPFDQYSEALIAWDVDPAPIIEAMLGKLRQCHQVDGLVLRKVKVSGPLFEKLRNKAYVVDEGAEAPQIVMDTKKPFEAFLQTTNAKTRKNLRNYTNRLQRVGDIEHTVLEGPETATVIAQCFDERYAWLSDTGKSSEAFRDPEFKSFLSSLAEQSQGNPLGLIAFVMTVDGEIGALQWGFVRGGCYYAFMSCRNPKFEQYSVGRIQLREIIEHCHNSGFGALDLMVPASPYKLNWTKKTEPVVNLVWPWSTKGHIVLGLVERSVRPAVKHCLDHAPVALRKPVMALINR